MITRCVVEQPADRLEMAIINSGREPHLTALALDMARRFGCATNAAAVSCGSARIRGPVTMVIKLGGIDGAALVESEADVFHAGESVGAGVASLLYHGTEERQWIAEQRRR